MVSRAPVALGIAVLMGLPAALRADPGTHSVSVSVGYATFSIPDPRPRKETLSPDGTTLAIDYELGLTDVVFLRISGGGGVYFGDERSYTGQGTIGLTYHLDVLRWVPFLSASAGGIAIGGAIP